MNFLLSLTISIFFISCWGQKVPKDTLYFNFDSNYISAEKNHEGVHAFRFKTEELVTSAFGPIIKEDLFFFTQSGFPPKKYSLKPKRVYSLQRFLKKKKFFRDASTGKLDAYKIMKYFDEFVVFFLVDNEFLKVNVHTSLSE
ncbi:hypothetical protein K1F50_20845 [Muricauda oceani]|uniref:Uncharacterized protein n=1 Tax=Flagellimonas oceani TaxID=2698672 RepID=A0A6G7J6C1_9FLAO|nr:hypothetical protein [Allomuricauda oceani]MBW8245258.1 hypothetical protein [Allomuricauda oceani]QII46431.1 hypothetical protein GVT53_17660 [Allomuricauda oceani]